MRYYIQHNGQNAAELEQNGESGLIYCSDECYKSYTILFCYVAFWILSLAALFNVIFIMLSVVMLNLVMLNAVAAVTD
jgi:hypothetical protein